MNMEKILKSIVKFMLLINSMCLPAISYAACNPTSNCCRSFPDAVQTNAAGGTITFGTACTSRVTSTASFPFPSTLPTGTVANCAATNTCSTNHGNAPCTPNACLSQGGSINLGTFPTYAGGSNTTVAAGTTVSLAPGTHNNVTVNNGGTLNLTGSGTYQINALNINATVDGSTTTVNLAAGNDYFLKNLTTTTTNVNRIVAINVTGTGVARVFINASTSISAAGNHQWNTSGTSDQILLIASFVNLTIDSSLFQMKGILYAGDTLTITRAANITGAITGAVSGASVQLGAGGPNIAFVQYDGTMLQNLTDNNFGGSSRTCNIAPTTQDSLSLSVSPNPANYCQTVTATVSGQFGGGIDTQFRDKIAIDTNNGTCTSGGGAGCFGTWTLVSGTGANFNAFGGNNGYAEYTFSGLEPTPGQAQFALVYPGNGLANPTIKVRDLSQPLCIAAVSTVLPFNPGSLAITSVAVPTDGPIPAGYSTNQTAGIDFSPDVILTAVSGSCTSNVVNASYTGSKTIKLCTTYNNPSTGTLLATINGVNTCSAGTPITFSNGTATLSGSTAVRYLDVGQITLSATDATTTSITGTSGSIVVKPGQFVISAISPSNPAAADSSGTTFVRAGQPFQLTVQARTAAYTGQPNGTITPNYNNETPAQGLTITPVLATNGGAVLGGISVSTPFTGAGTLTGSVAYSEVGIINVTTSVGTGSYLGAGNVSTAYVPNIGRFYPDHFDVTLNNTPQFAAGCASGGALNAFTYLGQPFNFSTQPSILVTARSANNTTTQNYRGTTGSSAYMKLSASNFSGSNQSYVSSTGQPVMVLSGTLPLPTVTDNNNGTVTVSNFDTNSLLSYALTAGTDISPFTAQVQLQAIVLDADNVPYGTANANPNLAPTSLNPFLIGAINPGTGIAFSDNAQMYQGRLFVNNASGSELVPLSVPMEAQYYTGSGYAINTKDSCTRLTATSNVVLSDPPTGGVTTSVSFTSTPLIFSLGSASFQLAAPTGSPTTGQKNIEIDLTATGANRAWLQYGWPFAAGLQNPRAQANFGFYPGESPRIIYQRESY